MDDWRDPAIYPLYRPHQLDLRLPDVFHHAVRIQRLEEPGPVPHRLVRRVALYPDADHSRYPYQQDPVHPEPGQLAADRHFSNHRLGGRLADGFAPGRHAWVCQTSRVVLATPGHHAAG